MELSELRKTPHLSASSVGEYVECGLLYKLGRIDRIPMEFKADALEFGTVIHIVLGEFYTEKMIVMGMAKDMFIVNPIPAAEGLPDQAILNQQGKGAIDGGPGDNPLLST